MSALVVAAVVVAAIGAWVAWAYNRLVRLRNQVATAWSDIDVQLQRRHDLVPQLVAAVKGYATHEGAVLEAVTALRSRALDLRDPAELGQVETELEQALGRLLLLREAYPELQASAGFARLQADLVDVEEQLQYARRFYNGAVRDLNDGVQRVPDVLVARGFGFDATAYFQAAADGRTAPVLEFPG